MHEQEAQLKQDVKEVHASLQVSNMLRNALADLRTSRELKADIRHTAVDMGIHFLVDRLILKKKGTGLKNYLIGAALRKLAALYLSKKKHEKSD